MQAAIQFGNQRPPNYKHLKINQKEHGDRYLFHMSEGCVRTTKGINYY